jgi:hypothetical protein
LVEEIMRAVHAQAGAVAVVLAIAVPSAAAEGCQSLAGKTLGHGTATVTDASIVAATGAEPEYCVAHVKFDD